LDTRGHLLFELFQLGADCGIAARYDLRGEDARIGGSGLADRHCSHGNSGGHLNGREQGV
jgi:hypothetical protein